MPEYRSLSSGVGGVAGAEAATGAAAAGAEATGTSGFLGALGQSVPLHAADEFSEFTTVRSGDLKDLGEFGGREGSF